MLGNVQRNVYRPGTDRQTDCDDNYREQNEKNRQEKDAFSRSMPSSLQYFAAIRDMAFDASRARWLAPFGVGLGNQYLESPLPVRPPQLFQNSLKSRLCSCLSITLPVALQTRITELCERLKRLRSRFRRRLHLVRHITGNRMEVFRCP